LQVVPIFVLIVREIFPIFPKIYDSLICDSNLITGSAFFNQGKLGLFDSISNKNENIKFALSKIWQAICPPLIPSDVSQRLKLI